MIANTPLSWHAAEGSSDLLLIDLLRAPAARQALDTLLATQMQLELATGVPVAVYGPIGQALPGISPFKARLADQRAPRAKDLLAPQNWPRQIGQMLEVISDNHLHFFITPFVVCSVPIAQVVLGPLQLFEPGSQSGCAESAGSSNHSTSMTGVPVLASWKAQAAAEIARTLVSGLCSRAADNPPRLSPPEYLLALSDQAIPARSLAENAPQRQQESSLRLGALAHDATLPERRTVARLHRITESTTMLQTSPEEQETTPVWPTPPRPLSANAYQTENSYGPASLLRHMIEAMPQAVIVSAAPDGQIVLANRAARALWPQWLGGSAESESSAPLSYRVKAEDYPPEWLGLKIALHQAESYRGEVSVELAEHEPPAEQTLPPKASPSDTIVRGPKQRPMLVTAFPLRAAQNVASHAIAIFEDLSGLLERELFKDELLLVAAHDIRNPLTLINSHAQLLERNLAVELPPGQLLERARGRLDAIQEQVKELNGLTNQLSSVTRLQSAQQRPYTETVNLARLIQRAAIDQQMLNLEHPIETVIERDPCLVQGDQTQLQQICLSLLKNAARYSHPGKPITVSLRCSPAHAPLWAEVSVRDQGIGIPRASLPHLFERFYRVSEQEQRARVVGIRPPGREGPNLGLGLYLCKQLLERMGGRIWLESVEGQGTTVTFRLPLKRSTGD
ncbi:MAG TPA: PAS domain-containing sensor histidine kinase [Ktedonobacterales bacterium]